MRFTKDHQWVELSGDVATVGITAYAAEQLGDVVDVQLPEAGKALKVGDGMAVLEGANATSEVHAPVGGEVTEANGDLPGAPEMILEDPEKSAWLVKIKVADTGAIDALMDRPAYEAFLDTL